MKSLNNLIHNLKREFHSLLLFVNIPTYYILQIPSVTVIDKYVGTYL
jgi:hypothetical protein